jgi:hypothetical protein
VDSLFTKRGNFSVQVVAHEVDFVPGICFGGMECGFTWRQGEDQPPVACVYGGKAEDIPEKGAISLGVIAVYDEMCAKDHELLPDVPVTIVGIAIRR